MREKILKSINNILKGNFELDDIIFLLSLKEAEDRELLYAKADEICRKVYGDKVYIRGIIELSNICRKDCLYCGIRRSNKNKNIYRITYEDILKIAEEGYKIGYKTIVLQAGEDLYYDDMIPDLIKEIKSKFDVAITLSLGERDVDVYKKWKEAGADRYLMRIETTDPQLFESLHPDDDLNVRKKLLFELKKMGYETGTGIMIGLPNQTIESIAKDIMFFKELDADMIGIGPFIPHKDTPLKDAKPGDLDLVLNAVAVIRLVLPFSNIPATTAMGSLDKLGRQKALKAGANVIMPNVTPTDYRPNYQLYDNKICIFEGSSDCRRCVEGIAGYAKKRVSLEIGPSKNKFKNKEIFEFEVV